MLSSKIIISYGKTKIQKFFYSLGLKVNQITLMFVIIASITIFIAMKWINDNSNFEKILRYLAIFFVIFSLLAIASQGI